MYLCDNTISRLVAQCVQNKDEHSAVCHRETQRSKRVMVCLQNAFAHGHKHATSLFTMQIAWGSSANW